MRTQKEIEKRIEELKAKLPEYEKHYMLTGDRLDVESDCETEIDALRWVLGEDV